MSEGRERRVEEALKRRGGGSVGKFDTQLHPRDRTGKWRETFSSPERPGMGPSRFDGPGPQNARMRAYEQSGRMPPPLRRTQQEFARPFGGPQSTAMPAPDTTRIPAGVRVGQRVTWQAGVTPQSGVVTELQQVVGGSRLRRGATPDEVARHKHVYQVRDDAGQVHTVHHMALTSVADAPAPASGREQRVQADVARARGQRSGAVVGGKAGRWVPIRGKKKHIPLATEWAHDAGGGVRFHSPAGTTDVFRTGPEGTPELVSTPGSRMTHPEVQRTWDPALTPGVAPAAPHLDPASSPTIAARQRALSGMTPGEHRMIDGVYVQRQASGDFTVHHGWGSPRYREQGMQAASDANLAASETGPHTVVLDSLHAAAEAAKNAPNINMTPMTTAHQMESQLKKGDKVAARYLSGGEHHGGNATVERVNQASIAVKMVDGPHAGRVVSVPRYQPFKPNSRWTVNNRVEPRNAKIDQHVSRVASTPISGGRLLQKAGSDTGRVSNAPRQPDGRLLYLVDGKGPHTREQALAVLGLPASGATPAEYEAWRRSQGLREATFSAGQRRKLAKRGAALPNGGFPIRNMADLKNAIQALGRAKDKAAAQRHIIKRAHALGLEGALPTDWKVKEADVSDHEDWYLFGDDTRTPQERARERRVALAMEELAHESLNRSPKKNWVERAGQLPAAIQHMAKDIHEERGLPLEQAIPIAISQAKKLAAKGNAKYVAAVAEWEALKAKSKGKRAA